MTAAATPTGAATPRPSSVNARDGLAAEFLRGFGVEIGALHLGMPIPPGARVRYLDRMPVDELRRHYPELRDWDLAPVDVVDDGERLTTIDSESVDFIVANHFLEHTEDPIATIDTHLSRLRPGGVLFYAVPDRRFTFDFRRDPTPLQHHIDDHDHGPERSRDQHYLEWASSVYEGEAPSDAQARAEAERLQAADYSIHFHVWEHSDLLELMLLVEERLQSFEIEAVRRNGIENIVVLRKHGTPPEPVVPDEPAPVADDAAVAGAAVAPRQTQRVALASLRAQLDTGEAASFWSIDPDGAPGRALVQGSGETLTIPLRLPTGVTLRGRVRLLPHDWRDGRGSVTARVSITEPGQERELWSQTIAAGSHDGDPAGVELRCELPSTATSVRLSVAPHAPGDRAVARALWVEPELIGDSGPDAAAVAAASPTPGAPPVPVAGRPLISVLTPVHDPSPAMLREAVESVRGQTFGDWELCLVDDGSRDPEIVARLRAYADEDPRIKLVRRERAGGIADATNAAVELASGEYVAFLDHDDWLGPDALAEVAARIGSQPELDMVYTDEDIVLGDTPVWVHLKPGWSPDTLNTNGYTCHLGVYRRALVQEIGGLRSEYNGSQDIDMILRLIERTDRIAHVPGVHYHWRIHPDSTAGGDAKPYAYVAARNAIAGHLERRGIDADVQYGPPGLYRVVHRLAPDRRVTLALALEDDSGMSGIGASWVAQSHPNWRVVLAGPTGVLERASLELRRSGVANHRIVAVPTGAADRHAALAAAAQAADDTDVLVLLQTPATGLTDDWLARLAGYATQPGIGAAGPIQLGPNGRIAEAGVAMPGGWPLPLLQGDESSMDRHFGYGTSVYDVAAVSGMLATSVERFRAVGGLRPDLAELALVDYCARAGDRGLRTVLVPDARLQITGNDRTMNDLGRMDRLARERRARSGGRDPYYNPLQRTDRGDFAPR